MRNWVLAGAAFLAPALAFGADVQILSAGLSDSAPCPGQVITLSIQVSNSNAFVGGEGRLIASVESSVTHPTCSAFNTATEADKWWVINAASTPSNPIAPVQGFVLDGGYNFSLAASETRTVAFAIKMPSLTYGGAYKLHLGLDDNYASGSGGTQSCLALSGCVPASQAQAQARVEGQPGNGQLQLVWLDYQVSNGTSNQARLVLDACQSVVSASGTLAGPASIVGNQVTWTLPDADAGAGYQASGSLYALVSLAGCGGSIVLTPQISLNGGAFAPGNQVSQPVGGAGLILAKQQLDANNLPIVSLNNGDTVKYVLNYSVSGSSLACFDGFDALTVGASYASPSAPPSWVHHPDTSGAWKVLNNGDGGRSLQYQNSPAGYAGLLLDCPAAKANGEDVCGGVLLTADVRVDGFAANGDAGLILRDNGLSLAARKSYQVILSVDPNPSGNLMLMKLSGTSPVWPALGASTTMPNGPVQGVWYTVKAMEQPIGTFYLKYWKRGTPEPGAWQVNYVDPSPFACGSASDGEVWRPGLSGMNDLMSYDDIRVIGAASVSGLQVWDTIPAGIDFMAASPVANGSVPSGSGSNEGAVRWDFTGNNYGAVAGILYNASGSFTWTGIVDCIESAGPVVNTALIKSAAQGAVASNSASLALNCAAPTPTLTPTTGGGSPTFTRTVTATPTRTPSNSVTPTPSTTPTIVSNLGLVKSLIGSAAPVTGQAIGYSIAWTYNNLAPLTADFQEIVDTLPAGFVYWNTSVASGPAPTYISFSAGVVTVRWTGSPAVVAGDSGVININGMAMANLGAVLINVASGVNDSGYAMTYSNPAVRVFATGTPTNTFTLTPTSTPTRTPVSGSTVTASPSATPTDCGGCSPTFTQTIQDSITATKTNTPGATGTRTGTPSYTPTVTRTPTPCSCTMTPTPTAAPSQTIPAGGCVMTLNTFRPAANFSDFGEAANGPADLSGLEFANEGDTVQLSAGQNGCWISEYLSIAVSIQQVDVHVRWRSLTPGSVLLFNYKKSNFAVGYAPHLQLGATATGVYRTDTFTLPAIDFFAATMSYYLQAPGAGDSVEVDQVSFDVVGTQCFTVTHFPTSTATPTGTSCAGCTQTSSPSATPTASPSVTACGACTSTFSPSVSASPTRTATPSATPTYCGACSATITASPTIQESSTFSPTRTPTPCGACSPTSTVTITPTMTSVCGACTQTFTPSVTRTVTIGQDPTSTPTRTATPTRTPTNCGACSPTFTPTITLSCPLCTGTFSPTISPTPTRTATPTATPSFSATISRTPTACGACTATFTPTPSPVGGACMTTPPPAPCAYVFVYAPVCGCNGVTYSNASAAYCAGVLSYTNGACGGPTPTATLTLPPVPGTGAPGTYPYPNPAKGTVNFAVRCDAPATATIQVLNGRGRVVAVITQRLVAGMNSASMDLSGYARGIYFYQVRLDYDDGRRSYLPVKTFMVRR